MRSFSRAPPAASDVQDLACLAAFADTGGLGLFSGLLAFGPPFGRAGLLSRPLPCATRRFRGATSACLVGFGGCNVAAAGGLDCFSALDVMVLKSKSTTLPSRAGGTVRAVLVMRPDASMSERCARSDECDLEGQIGRDWLLFIGRRRATAEHFAGEDCSGTTPASAPIWFQAFPSTQPTRASTHGSTQQRSKPQLLEHGEIWGGTSPTARVCLKSTVRCKNGSR